MLDPGCGMGYCCGQWPAYRDAELFVGIDAAPPQWQRLHTVIINAVTVTKPA